jgi:hypothetical protein
MGCWRLDEEEEMVAMSSNIKYQAFSTSDLNVLLPETLGFI